MRVLFVCPMIIAAFVWLASAADIQEFVSGRATEGFSEHNLTEPDPHVATGVEVIPAGAEGAVGPETVYAQGIVNLRAGPGLDYRMLTVAAHGDALRVEGPAVEGWLPVCEPNSRTGGWISTENFTIIPPLR
ncbi:MAG: SH3 domain-containing protein [Pikeienuella sp.]